MPNSRPFKYSVAALRDMAMARQLLHKLAGILTLATIIMGVPYVILSWIFGAIMCGGGSGPNTSYCM